jgi:hypothetical protein
MLVPEPTVTAEQEPEAEKFYEGAYARIARIMVVVAVVASLAALFRFGWRVGAGVAIGCALAGVNFIWMKRAITAFAGRIAEPEQSASARGSATRFAARYGLIAAVAYVIFRSSIVSLSGVLVGLFLPVAAILAEAVYETYVALRRGL